MAQIQKWWQVDGASGANKQQIQTLSSGFSGRIETWGDSTKVQIIDKEGHVTVDKQIGYLASNVATTDGLDSLGKSYLLTAYTISSLSGNNLIVDKLGDSDTISAGSFFSKPHTSFYQPLKLINFDQSLVLLSAVYLPDSSSFLSCLKIDFYSGSVIDSFSTPLLFNTSYSYAETFGNKAIVHGITSTGRKNWLLDFSSESINEWQWNYGSNVSTGSERIAFTRNGSIFSVVHSNTDTTQMDALLTLCDTNLTVNWTIRYNSEFNLNDSIVDLSFYQDKIYIAGIVQKDSINKDYLIASLNHDGTMNWELKYDGPGVASVDVGVSLCVDEVGDIFFTGHSMNNNLSTLFSIQLDEFGNVLWESDIADAAYKRAAKIVTRDGRIYLSGHTLTGSINNFLILYKDSIKIESIQKLHLEMLASGFSIIQEDTLLKQLVWDKFSRQYSFRRTVSVSSMQKFLRTKGIDLYRLMNAKINSEFKLDKKSKTVELILSSLKSKKEIPFIHFPFFDNLQSLDFIGGRNTVFAYSQAWPASPDEPIACFSCEEPIVLQPGQADVIVINLEGYIGVAGPNDNNLYQECEPRHVIRCIYEDGGDNESFVVCAYQQNFVINPIDEDFLGDYEIGVDIPSHFINLEGCSYFNGVLPNRLKNVDEQEYFDDNLIEFHRYPPGIEVADVFILEEVGNNKVYLVNDVQNGLFKPTCYPIAFASYYGQNNISNGIGEFYENISSITLCGNDNEMGTMGEEDGQEIKLAAGGIYRLRSVFTNVPPVYFVQVWGEGVFYQVGPDFSINLNLYSGFGEHCVEGTQLGQIAVSAKIDRCQPCSENVRQLFSEPLQEHINKRVANYDLEELRVFWESSNLYLGLKTISNNSMVLPNNFIKLPNADLPACLTMTNPTLICEFNCLEDNSFKFRSASQYLNIPANVPLNIEVIAKFEDGLEINTCFSHTFIGEPNQVFSSLTVLPTGRLKDWMPNSENYRIRIYQDN